MNRTNMVITILMGILFYGCASQTSVIMMDDYKGKELSANQLAIAPYRAAIKNEDDVADDLGTGNAVIVYRNFADSLMSASISMNSRVDKVIIGRNMKYYDLVVRKLDLKNGKSIRMALPRDNESFEIDSIRPDYILYFSDYSIERSAGSPGSWVGGGPGRPGSYVGGSSGSLIHQTDFCLWDNSKGRIVSYGKTAGESSIGILGMTKNCWIECIQQLTRSIMKASSLYSGHRTSPAPESVNYISSDSSSIPVMERSFYLKIKGGYGLDLHSRDQESVNPDIPPQFQNTSENPSVAYFFHDGSGFNIDLSGSVLINSDNILRLVIGVTYERSTSTNSYHQDTEQILGDELVITSFCPYIGIEKRVQLNYLMAYGYLGPCFKTYEGRYTESGLDWKSIYKPTVAFRIGGGLEIQNVLSRNLFLNIGIVADLGSVDRDKVEIYQSGQLVAIGTPTGENNLKDVTFHLQLSIGYIFDKF